MRLEEPEILVDLPGDSREQIRGICVSQVVRVVDRGPYRLAEYREMRRQIEQMILAGRNAQRIVLQLAALGGHRHGAFGRTAQARYAFGDFVDLFQYEVGNLVEQLVQSDEIRTLDIPVCLFDLALQIDRIGQSIVEYDD